MDCDSESDSDDLINAFQGFEKPKRQIIVPRPQNEYEVKVFKEEIIEFKRESKGVDYSNKIREKEDKRLADQSLNLPTTSSGVTINVSDNESGDEGLQTKPKMEITELPELDVYSRYDFNITPQNLPILEKRKEIIENIKIKNKALVLTASTGTGKSSQVPQYILEEAQKRNEKCNIIVTQPRRIAAISIAKRVALERKCDLGTLVGYQIGLDSKKDINTNSDTRILFCTNGVLLQQLINERSMKRYSHVILDEVHERDVEMDMLLILVRSMFSPDVKIILMSATLVADKIAAYFSAVDHLGELVPAPILDLNVPRRFPTKTTYLDSLENFGASRDILNIDNPGISDRMYKVALKVIEEILSKTKDQSNPSFLLFLPGIQEIDRMHQELYVTNENLLLNKFSIVKLHSSLPSDEFEKSFDANVANKIILATNIAESSLTLPGVRFVIDFCLTKYLQTDTATNITQLKLDWASQMSQLQRAGRVGRLEAGQVIRLIYKDQFNKLPLETTPEIKRSSLESVVLKVKRLKMGKPVEILGKAMDPPPENAIDDSILVLKEIGALTRISKKKRINDHTDGDLTFTGDVMARLPIDVRISKLIVLGFMCSCLEECIIIGAGFASKSVFKTNIMSTEEKMKSFEMKLEQAAGSGSDGFATLNAYRKWRKAVEEEDLKNRREKEWCNLQMLNLKNLQDMHLLVEEIKKRLRYFEIKVEDTLHLSEEEKIFMAKICIAGAFYPNYFLFGGKPPGKEEFKVLNNMNPCTTVFFKGMPSDRIGQIYEKQVREVLHEKNVADELNEMKVKFDGNSTRLQVEFKPMKSDGVTMVPGEVAFEVYKAAKLSKMEGQLNILIMPKSKEDIFASEKNLGTWKNGKFVFHKKNFEASHLCVYPTMHQREFKGRISYIVNCSKFFYQPAIAIRRLDTFQNTVKNSCEKMTNLHQALEGSFVLVKHDKRFKRVKLIEMPDEEDDDEDPDFSVFLIDYGEVLDAKMRDLYVCSEPDDDDSKKLLQYAFEMPPLCFECRLSEIIPSALKCSTGWSVESKIFFEKFVYNRKVNIFVNSFVDRIASVRLSVSTTSGRTEYLDDHLIIQGYAQRSDDSYIRLLDQNYRDEKRDDLIESKSLENEFIDVNIPAPDGKQLKIEVTLNGPYSPLEVRPESLCRENSDSNTLEISVEPSSVNHVLIDPFPNEMNKKVLVAASMSSKNNRVMLHQTSIMPHIPGMACLLGLIFSPIVQVRATAESNRYTSILTGLGCDSKRKPHFGEHDCMFFVDVDFDEKDFEMINDLRHQMSFVMQTDTEEFKKERNLKSQKRTARFKISQLLIEIFAKERKPLGVNMENSEWNWHITDDNNYGVEPSYPKIYAESLLPISEITARDLKHHAEELKMKADTNARDECINCRLCEEGLETVIDLKLHVMKKLHKERLLQIRDETLVIA